MKEVTLSDEDIIKVLKEEKHIKLSPICINCTHDIIDLVLSEFSSAVILVDRLDKDIDDMFSLMVRV